MLGVIRVDFHRNYAIIANYYLARRRRKMPFQIPLPAPSDPPIISLLSRDDWDVRALIYRSYRRLDGRRLASNRNFPALREKLEAPISGSSIGSGAAALLRQNSRGRASVRMLS